MDHRPVTRGPAHPQRQPPNPLLGGLDQVSTRVVLQRDREAPHLTDRLGHPLEQLRPVLHQPLRPEEPTRLLIGEEREHDVPRRHDPVPLEPPSHRQGHRHHVLHVDSPTPPHVAVLHRPRERVHRPLRRISGHHVQMPMHQQRPTRPIRPRQPGDHIPPPLGPRLHVRRLVPHLSQLLGHPLRRRPLPDHRRGIPGVRRIDPDQLTGQLHDLVLRHQQPRTISHVTHAAFLPPLPPPAPLQTPPDFGLRERSCNLCTHHGEQPKDRVAEWQTR